ncbi:hypothetical protein Pyn_40259 [Prunus yedoensis var. nudiflora]|uniref:Uncharacterized protein n=1 Tax=Prunus yedoensis var. nudiflora TaxID=2094558 RepID=A0A314Y6B1_PRUYE|nr:hypothetical protein Pyn_40259 [Prunus yedoensis var. nudiflora]
MRLCMSARYLCYVAECLAVGASQPTTWVSPPTPQRRAALPRECERLGQVSGEGEGNGGWRGGVRVGRAPSVVEVPSSSEETGGEAETEGENLERHPDAEAAKTEAEVEGFDEAEDPDRPRVDLDGVPLAVSNAQGSGEPSCSYRQGVPVHPYFYKEGECSPANTWVLRGQGAFHEARWVGSQRGSCR